MSLMERALAPLQRRVMLMIGRAVLQAVKDSTQIQSLQVNLLADETREDAERFQQYGMTSHPHPGAECIVLSVMGNRDHPVVIAVDDRRYRLQALEQGEVALYTDEGDSIILKRDREIWMTAGTRVRIDSPLVDITNDVSVGGTVYVGVDVIAAGKSLVHHIHQEQGDGSPTSPPL